MAKVLLILPPWYIFLGDGFNEIPVGLCSLAAHLNRHGHDAWVYNADFSPGRRQPARSLHDGYGSYHEEFKTFGHPVWLRVRERIEQMQPDIVGIHFKTGAIESVRQVARLARTAAPKCTIVVGGPHPSLMPEETASIPDFDIVVRGEGEETLREIADQHPFNFTLGIAGTVFRDGDGKVVSEKSRQLIENLDTLAEPDHEHLIDRELYSDFGHGIIMTARGCPFDCTYCGSKAIWTRRVRYRSADRVVAEVAHLRERFGTRYFNFRDDTFTIDRKRTLEICRLLRERVPGIAWRCDTRGDCIDEELARAMRQAGCVQSNVGIESGSERILKMIKKGERKEQISRGIACLKRSRISVSAFIMIGFPTETTGDVMATIDFVTRLSPDFLVLSILTPYPGTEIHDCARKKGLIAPEITYADYFHQSPRMGLMEMPPAVFDALREKVFAQVDAYNRSLLRKAHRFFLIFLQNPKAAVEKLKSYLSK
jgi:anaerobic magnesium-protoporphyrin IX monomethyl ester cyclase